MVSKPGFRTAVYTNIVCTSEFNGGTQMLRKLLFPTLCLGLISGAGLRLSAAAILLPGGSLIVPSLSTTGVSFIYTGTLTQNDTLALTQTGDRKHTSELQSRLHLVCRLL